MPGSGLFFAGWCLRPTPPPPPPRGDPVSWPLFYLVSLAAGQKKKKKIRCLAFATRSRGLAFPLFHFSAFPFARHCVSVWPARTFIRVTRYPLELPKIPCPQRTPPHTYFIPLVLQFFLISTPLFFYFFFGNTQSRKIWGLGECGAYCPTTNSHNHKLAYVRTPGTSVDRTCDPKVRGPFLTANCVTAQLVRELIQFRWLLAFICKV